VAASSLAMPVTLVVTCTPLRRPDHPATFAVTGLQTTTARQRSGSGEVAPLAQGGGDALGGGAGLELDGLAARWGGTEVGDRP
jgi:hypothetical protein